MSLVDMLFCIAIGVVITISTQQFMQFIKETRRDKTEARKREEEHRVFLEEQHALLEKHRKYIKETQECIDKIRQQAIDAKLKTFAELYRDACCDDEYYLS